MPKTLKINPSRKCNGCEMCVIAVQQQLEKVGLDESLIRIFAKKEEGAEYPTYTPDVDPRVNSIDIQKIKAICPRKVYEIEDA